MHQLLIPSLRIKLPAYILKLVCALCLILSGSTSARAQAPFGFQRNLSIPVFDFNDSNPLPNAWAGGFNAPQFNECDLNGDALLDLVVFERTGNKLLCFLRTSTGNSFQYAPEYQGAFPSLHDWMILRDYDMDGKTDVFTSGGNGIRIFKNTSTGLETTSFTLITDLLYSDYGNALLNLFVSPVDIPAIDDIDNDGDLDILTFYILGTCVEYHRNLSQELFGHSDSLRFQLESSNWGNFTESSTDNSVNYNDSCGRNAGVRHSGSTLLLDDIDHDGDQDLLLGDVSYPELLCLINAPAAGIDRMIPMPASYPTALNGFSVPIFPGAFRIHANGDTFPDLVIAPNTELQSLNKGRLARMFPSDGGTFNFTLPQTPFLSHEQLDFGRSAYPCFIDNDADGDLDLIVGNYGEFEPNSDPVQEGNYRASLQLLENTGSNQLPVFKLRNTNIGQLNQINTQHLAPAAIDLNADGRTDLIVGKRDGTFIALLKNQTGNDYTLSNGFVATTQADQYATPTIADVNQDGKLDLITGGKSGRLQCFLNNGNNTLSNFPSTADYLNWGNVETIQEGFSNFGYSAPAVYKNQQESFIVSGSESGRLFVWQVDPANPTAPFTVLDSSQGNLFEGIWSAPTLSDLNGDGYPEMILGTKRGGLNYFNGSFPISVAFISETHPISIFPNPARDEFTIQSELLNYPLTVELIDLSGRKIMQQSLTSSNQRLPVIGVSSGMYVVLLTDRNNQVISRQRLVVSR